MGCIQISFYRPTNQSKLLRSIEKIDHTISTSTINECEVDRSHFSQSKQLLGFGGFGIVRLVEKTTGNDRGKLYALKSMSKIAILKRPSGVAGVLSELTSLAILKEFPFICNVQYAFQDSTYLYLVLDLATNGDLRMNIRRAKDNRFAENICTFFITQIILAVEYCSLNILHRGI
jgi:serine/threonine protein kinase